MRKDVKFDREDGSFKLRVCGVVKVGDKYLIENGDNSPFWGYPGGHVELGEDSKSAVIREVKEETELDIEIVKYLANIQLFFKREDNMIFHEIGYYYLLKCKKKISPVDFSITENDKGEIKTHVFKWVTKEELKILDVRPVALKKIIIEDLENQSIISRINV